MMRLRSRVVRGVGRFMMGVALLLASYSLTLGANYPNQILTTIESNTDGPLGNTWGLYLNSDDSRLYATYWQCPSDPKVEEYDLSDLSLIQSMSFGSCHADVVQSSNDRYLFSANYYPGTISRIDLLGGNAEQTLYVGPWPCDLDITPDKSKILVKVGMDGRPYDMNNDRIAIVDVATFSVLAQVALDDEPGGHKIGFSTDGTKAYVAANRRKSSSAKLYEISLVSPYSVLRTLLIPGNVNPDWGWLGVAATNSRVFVGDYLNSRVLVVDLASFTIVNTISIGREPGVIAITPDGNYLFVLDSPNMGLSSNTVSIIDVSSEVVVEQFVLDNPRPNDIEFSKDGSRAYISHYFAPPGPGAITVLACTPLQTAALDIKPGFCPNPLVPRDLSRDSRAVVPAAILGTDEFDITEIDPTTVTLAGIPPIRWAVEDVAAPVSECAVECECTEAGPDGFEDLTLKFDKSAIVAALGEVQLRDTVSLTITGELYDGTPFEGSDCVIIVGPEMVLKNDPTPDADGPSGVTLINHPNPFNPTTEISFGLPEASNVKIQVFNVMGQLVETLVDGYREAGVHTVTWTGSNAASGVYFYRLEANDYTATRKMLLLK